MKARTALLALTATLVAVPAAQAATIKETYTSVTRVNGTDPSGCNKLGVLKIGPSKAKNVKENISLAQAKIPAIFWADMKTAGLIAKDYPYLG